MKLQRRLVPILLVLLVACGATTGPPPNLSPAGKAAYYGTRAIKTLDLVMDTAIAANEQVPPLLSTANTRIVVDFHQSALRTIHAVPDGWKATVLAGLDELKARLGSQYAVVEPYINLVKTIIQETP